MQKLADTSSELIITYLFYTANSRHVVRYTDSIGLCRLTRDKIKNMRSSLIELIQCNRNPFIDHSEEAELILGF